MITCFPSAHRDSLPQLRLPRMCCRILAVGNVDKTSSVSNLDV
jgi:hypothetical protein